MKKYISLFIAVILIAVLLGCHAGGNAPFVTNNSETVVSPETRIVDANGRFTDITFPSGAIIKCPNDNTFQEGVKVTAIEEKIPVTTDNSGTFSYNYVYKISAVLPSENSLTTDVPVNTIEKPLSVTLPNGSTAGTCYIGTRASENDPWRYSLASDGINSNARFMRLSANPPKTCTFDLYRLNIQFRLFVFDNEEKKDEVQVDALTLAQTAEVVIKDGKYTGNLTVKLKVDGNNLNSLKAKDLIAKIIYRSENQQGANINFVTNKTDSSDKAVSGSYEHSFEISNIKVENTLGNTAELSFELNLDGVSLADFPTNFLVEFYSKGSDENTRPFEYTQAFNFETKGNQNYPTYIITYVLDGGEPTGNNPTSYDENTDDIILSNPTKDGYIFTGWTGSNGDTPERFVKIEKGTTGDKSYTANYSAVAYTITYTLGADDVTNDNPSGFNSDSETFTLKEPERTGYSFTGWSGTDLTGEANKQVTITKGTTGNKEYTAHWSINSYNLTINKGTGIDTVTGAGSHEYNSSVTASCTMLAGYEFDKWTGDLTTETFNMPANNATMTANAKAITYNITFKLDGGQLTSDNPLSYTVETETFNLPTPTKDYYDFLGWSINDGTPEENVTIVTGSTDNKIYTANYRLSTYTITLEGCADATVDYISKNYNIETADFTLPKPTKKNSVFQGWCLNNGAPVENVTISQGTHENRTYVASWTLADVLTFTLAEGVTLEMKRCPAGTFLMGSPESDNCREDDEIQHSVTISKDYWMGTYEVTQSQYRVIMGSNPSSYNTEDESVLPVNRVSWDNLMTESTGFYAKLNASLTAQLAQLPGTYTFDLPTEAQWEYACRAGTTSALNNGKEIVNPGLQDSNLDEVAWYSSNWGLDNSKSHTVGGKAPNAWGLYDMHGNVAEWCKDFYADYPTEAVTDPFCDSGSNRVARGGGWANTSKYCRSACRDSLKPTGYNGFWGFRLVLVAVE